MHQRYNRDNMTELPSKVKFNCEICGKERTTKRSQYIRAEHHFCGKACYWKWFTKNQIGENNHNYKGEIITRICQQCGKSYPVYPSRLKYGSAKYCTSECYKSWRKQEADKNAVEVTCIVCGMKKKIKKSRFLKGKDKTCSKKCEAIQKSRTREGKNNPNYVNGESNLPYCEKFNRNFRKRVRAFFGNKCVYCGKTKVENNNKNMSVHHVTYQKGICCDGDDINGRLFVTLCDSHHPMTNAPRKREYWKKYFTELIKEKYNGKCYYTKDELKILQETTDVH